MKTGKGISQKGGISVVLPMILRRWFAERAK